MTQEASFTAGWQFLMHAEQKEWDKAALGGRKPEVL